MIQIGVHTYAHISWACLRVPSVPLPSVIQPNGNPPEAPAPDCGKHPGYLRWSSRVASTVGVTFSIRSLRIRW